jgi:8-oxo-dGTP pyrophosphatase MutT (NUDIX family)
MTLKQIAQPQKSMQSAGCIIVAQDTGRFCLALRSAWVQAPGTWGTIGGDIEDTESAPDAVRRELSEETGYQGKLLLVPLWVFRKQWFTYYNYLAVVPQEFDPSPNWETEKFGWFEFGAWPTPLHPGLRRLLQDSASVQILKNATSL